MHWLKLTRSAAEHSPDGTRRPWWLLRPVRPVRAAYELPRSGGRSGAAGGGTALGERGGAAEGGTPPGGP